MGLALILFRIFSLFLRVSFLLKIDLSFGIFTISGPVIIGFTIIMTLFFIFIVVLGIKAQFKKNQVGRETMKGLQGMALEDISPLGRVRVNGEIWKAKSSHENIKAHSRIEVIEVKNFFLIVKRVPLNP